ncbi:transposase [Palleronia aestuarii]|uniref:transposase n=1 Tax=Palleronia aestuarii TaxID=568105 RepID=UPI00357163E0
MLISKDNIRRVEVITGAAQRGYRAAHEKLRIIQESLASGGFVSAVARRNGVAPNFLFRWRWLMDKDEQCVTIYGVDGSGPRHRNVPHWVSSLTYRGSHPWAILPPSASISPRASSRSTASGRTVRLGCGVVARSLPGIHIRSPAT